MSTRDTCGSEPEPTVSNVLVSAETFGSQTGARSNGMLFILQVQVKAKKAIKSFKRMRFWTMGQHLHFALKV